MTTRVRSLAIESIADMLALADSEERELFPPTELYGEGWTLRLVLDSAFRGSAKLPFPSLNGARCYSEAQLTPEGYRFYDASDADSTYGIRLKPVTMEIITSARARSQLREYGSLDEAPYLSHPATGEAQVWSSGDPRDEIRFYSGPGYDPDTAQPLEPITPEGVHTYRETKGAAEERAALWRAREAERSAKRAEVRRRVAADNAQRVEQARQGEEAAETAQAQKTKNGPYRRLETSRVACSYRCRSRGGGEACVQRCRSQDERRC